MPGVETAVAILVVLVCALDPAQLRVPEISLVRAQVVALEEVLDENIGGWLPSTSPPGLPGLRPWPTTPPRVIALSRLTSLQASSGATCHLPAPSPRPVLVAAAPGLRDHPTDGFVYGQDLDPAGGGRADV